MTAAEAIAELNHLHQAASGADDSIFTDTQRAWIDSLRKQELGGPVRLCNCRDRYKDAVIELLSYFKRTQTMQHERKYMLRRGILIWLNNDAYSCLNLTDEVAEAYLELHPDAANKFEKLPKASAKKIATESAQAHEPNKEPADTNNAAVAPEIKPDAANTAKPRKTTRK